MKILLFICSILVGIAGNAQTTATNFNCNDCSGQNHDLFKELDEGKVIVISWVMPCTSCEGPTKTAYNIVQSYATSNPNKVFIYICDDYADLNCTSLGSWVDSKGMQKATKFSNASIKMSDYGADGMPKIVILGGSQHKVFFNENNASSGNVSNIQEALKSAIEASSSIGENLEINAEFKLFPNPSNDDVTLQLQFSNPTTLNIELMNTFGQTVLTIAQNERISAEIQHFKIPTKNISDGIYFVMVKDQSRYKFLKLVISHS